MYRQKVLTRVAEHRRLIASTECVQGDASHINFLLCIHTRFPKSGRPMLQTVPSTGRHCRLSPRPVMAAYVTYDKPAGRHMGAWVYTLIQR